MGLLESIKWPISRSEQMPIRNWLAWPRFGFKCVFLLAFKVQVLWDTRSWKEWNCEPNSCYFVTWHWDALTPLNSNPCHLAGYIWISSPASINESTGKLSEKARIGITPVSEFQFNRKFWIVISTVIGIPAKTTKQIVVFPSSSVNGNPAFSITTTTMSP